MKLTNILEKENNALIFEQHMNNSRTILSESVEGMNAVQRAIVEGIYNDLKPLIEASLTADQVQQLFKGVEQHVSATGNNRTLVGEGKDAVSKATDTINKVGRWLQDTTPVKGADEKFEQIKSKISTKFPDLEKQLSRSGNWMKENPGKSAASIGVVTAIAGLATCPVGGALAEQILSIACSGKQLRRIQNQYLYEDLDAIVNTSRRSIFESIGQGDAYFTQWEKEIHPVLCEVALTPDQIQQLFTTIEKGSDRTLLGKGMDAAGAAKDKISDVWFNKFGGMLQSSGPVKAFDAQYDKLVSSIAKKYPEIAAKVKKYQAWAKENPNLQKFLLAIVGSVAAALGVAAAGGVAAGALAIGTGTAIAVGIVNIADRLLKGEKASTAIGRGATTGAIAGLAAGGAAKIGDMIKAGLTSDVIADLRGMKINKHYMDYNGTVFNAVTKEPETSALKNAFDSLMPKFGSGGVVDPNAVNKFAEMMAKVASPEYQEMIGKTREIAIAAKEAAKSSIALVTQLQQVGAAVAGGVASAATAGGAEEKPATPKESFTVNGKKLSEGQVYMIFDRVCSINNQMLSEGKIWEADDPAAPKMSTWQKIKTKASEFGKNLTTKVTASKLNSAWKAAKQPTDSEELGAFLVKQGVNAEVVGKTFVDMKLPKPKSTQAAAEKKPAAEKPVVGAGQGAATGTPAATAPTPATTPTVEKPAVSTSAAGGDVDATPQPNAAGAGLAKNTNTLYSQVRADIKRLDKRSKQQLMSYLEKGLSA